jgi:quinol monooxygenase YgiN
VIAVVQLRPAADADQAAFHEQAAVALRTLADRPGFRRGSLGRATDDSNAWLLFTEWESVGAYRRALGGYQVKLLATPVLARALDQPSAFEELLRIDDGGAEQESNSDRAPDADWAPRHPAG